MINSTMKTFFLLLIATFSCLTKNFGQSLSLEDLQKVGKMSPADIDFFLLRRNFELSSSENDTSIGSIKVEYVQNPNPSKRTLGTRFITITKYRGAVDLSYMTVDKNEYVKAKEYVVSKKFIPQGNAVIPEVGSGIIRKTYASPNKKVFIELISSKEKNGSTEFIQYTISVSDQTNYVPYRY